MLESLNAPLLAIGCGLPLLLVMAGAVVGAPVATGAVAAAGAAAVCGGVLWKFTVIVRAAYQQGFALPSLPRRGSGSKAAPTRLQGLAGR